MIAGSTDTSAVLALLLHEPSAGEIESVYRSIDHLHAAPLLEAEVRSVAAREAIGGEDVERILAGLSWIRPDHQPRAQCQRVLDAGWLRGADIWHLACALYVTPIPSEFTFVTLDRNQARVARALGFRVVP